IALLPGNVHRRFSGDPLGVLTTDLGLTVRAVDHLANSRDAGGACDGLSFLQDGVILYSPTPASRRENFTLAHELGHWLAENTPGVYDWLADQDDPARLLETVCDRIAQQLLLPDSAAQSVVGSGPVRAGHLFELYDATQASRPACAIALAKQLVSLGAVAILDRATGEVTHASVNPDPEQGWPTVFPWRGQRPGAGHPLSGMTAGSSLTRRVTWRTPWNSQAEFYVDAVSDGRRVVAVFSDRDLWGCESFHAPIERSFDTRPLLRGRCCGRAFERRGYPCPNCGQPFCPQCEKCRCERDAAREIRCDKCFQLFLPHLVVDGRCVECR
ncbi:MAG: ImmA/IrrE family metallo-endopeptidase, partial [Actinobacteria bacterium]|nr:ImmA/IrrE family metallo-endopeptidase [Actinomycetota bacterium]